MKKFRKLNRKAFTLAEVLIVLGIIGIVAELTIPDLYANFQEQVYKTAYKKAYSVASQAWLSAYSKGNLELCVLWGDDSSHTCNIDDFKAFKAEFKVIKDCGTNTANCWDMSGQQTWGNNAYPRQGGEAFVDNSGMVWAKSAGLDYTYPPAGEVFVDTNGSKGPNKFGKDRAIFVLYYYSVDQTPAAQLYVYADTLKAYTPTVYLLQDYPNSTTDLGQQYSRCPSMDTNPCYYTSWITGAH